MDPEREIKTGLCREFFHESMVVTANLLREGGGIEDEEGNVEEHEKNDQKKRYRLD